MEVDGDGGPVQWVLWMDQRGTREPLGADFTMNFIAPNVNTSADVFSFTSSAPTFDEATAKEDLINVFPNPYLGFNLREENSFTRFVTFSHLPELSTIRIFTLAGTLVRTIMKSDESQFINWNLQNEFGLPVASGIYIAHISTGVGTRILKMAIVQEQQFLRNF